MTNPHTLAVASPLGAVPQSGGTRFTVPAPAARVVEVRGGAPGTEAPWLPMARQEDGTWTSVVEGVGAGDRYQYRVDGGPAWPDPASRFQPEGVHGPSEIVDPAAFAWHDQRWTGIGLEDVVIYEMHVGAFTPEGTFAAAADRLPELRALGITAVELMPLADFPGGRNWGYDGVSLFAPARAYGRPDDLRRLVDRAHALGLAAYLDVVYNHLGPDGAYVAALLPAIFSTRHNSPWGRSLNFDDEGGELWRRLVIENAVAWMTDYHFDGLRFDATHIIEDDGPRHILAEVTTAVRRATAGRRVQLIAEDNRNLASMMRPVAAGGLGFDAVWADDFHHQVRRCLAGDSDGYYADFTGAVADLATTIREGWFYRGQYSAYQGQPRGTSPDGVAYSGFVITIQNHDQIGNRALGDRLHHGIDAASYRAASVLLLLAPETPLLFMGQEWAASSPFQFFTDHEPELGRQVTAGRRQEFQRFKAFSRPEAAKAIPDPQAVATFERSHLRREEAARSPHAGVETLYRDALALRHAWKVGHAGRAGVTVATAGEWGLAVTYRHDPAVSRTMVVWLRGAGTAAVECPGVRGDTVQVVLTTESPSVVDAPEPAAIDVTSEWIRVRFSRPGAVALEWPSGDDS